MTGFKVDLTLERRPDRGEPFTLRATFETGAGITVVAGPSGAGKSSLQLGVLGALRPSAGRLEISGVTLFDSDRGVDLSIRRRRVGMVFQDALLFPHLDALGNVCFGMSGTDRRARARTLLERVGAVGLAARRPAELSGGQRQRVALARALAAAPAALLLDEPFSALDARGRDALGGLLIELQAESGIPFMHVTHDLAEALRLGHHLVLLDQGRVVACGRPAELIARPGSLAAARAVGTENVLGGTIRLHRPETGLTEVEIDGTTVQTGLLELPVGARVTLGLRAEEILLALEPAALTSARNLLPGRIEELSSRGSVVEARVSTPASFRVMLTPAAVTELGLEVGRPVYLLIKASGFHRLA